MYRKQTIKQHMGPMTYQLVISHATNTLTLFGVTRSNCTWMLYTKGSNICSRPGCEGFCCQQNDHGMTTTVYKHQVPDRFLRVSYEPFLLRALFRSLHGYQFVQYGDPIKGKRFDLSPIFFKSLRDNYFLIRPNMLAKRPIKIIPSENYRLCNFLRNQSHGMFCQLSRSVTDHQHSLDI